jgi:hypothetical protein
VKSGKRVKTLSSLKEPQGVLLDLTRDLDRWTESVTSHGFTASRSAEQLMRCGMVADSLLQSRLLLKEMDESVPFPSARYARAEYNDCSPKKHRRLAYGEDIK